MKPFNLELALQGHPVITRSGVEVKQFIVWDIEGEFKLHANVNGIIKIYKTDGKFDLFGTYEYPEDLFMADHEPLTYKKLSIGKNHNTNIYLGEKHTANPKHITI